MANVDWQIIFYIDQDRSEPVKDYILRQSDGAIAEILHVFKLLRQFNVNLGMPYVRKIGKTGIRELRIKHGSDIHRIFFCALEENKFKLLHAFTKKQDKTPEAEMKLAIQRMNEYK
jgi:phage-related protein